MDFILELIGIVLSIFKKILFFALKIVIGLFIFFIPVQVAFVSSNFALLEVVKQSDFVVLVFYWLAYAFMLLSKFVILTVNIRSYLKFNDEKYLKEFERTYNVCLIYVGVISFFILLWDIPGKFEESQYPTLLCFFVVLLNLLVIASTKVIKGNPSYINKYLPNSIFKIYYFFTDKYFSS